MHFATKIGLFFQARRSAKSCFVVSFSVVLSLLALSASTAQAGTCTASTTGNWSAAGTWTGSCTGTGNVIPGPGDNVVINSGVLVTFNMVGGATINQLNVNAAAVANGLTLNGNSLTVNGSITISAPTAVVTSKIDIGSGTLVAAGLVTVTGTNTANQIAELLLGAGTLTLGQA
jgi:hypothetical protein